MSELRPCPFCGMEFEIDEYEPGEFKIRHPSNEDCPMGYDQIWCGETFFAKHNARPIEDALRADLEELHRLWNEPQTINEMDDERIYAILAKYAPTGGMR